MFLIQKKLLILSLVLFFVFLFFVLFCFILFIYYRDKMPKSLRLLQGLGPLEFFSHLFSLKWNIFSLSLPLFSSSSFCYLIFASFSRPAFPLSAHLVLLTTVWCQLLIWHLSRLWFLPTICCERTRSYEIFT